MAFFNEIEQHRHNGLDAPRIKPFDLEGFPVYQSEAKLTFERPEGTIALRWKTSDNTYYLTALVNKGWREVQIS
jgi:hypothetical protein